MLDKPINIVGIIGRFCRGIAVIGGRRAAGSGSGAHTEIITSHSGNVIRLGIKPIDLSVTVGGVDFIAVTFGSHFEVSFTAERKAAEEPVSFTAPKIFDMKKFKSLFSGVGAPKLPCSLQVTGIGKGIIAVEIAVTESRLRIGRLAD